MGKYSLDAFERYPLTKLRPKMAAPEVRATPLVSLALPALPDRVPPGSLLRLTWREALPDAASVQALRALCRSGPPAGIIAGGNGCPDPAALDAVLRESFPDVPVFTAPDDPLMSYGNSGLFLDLSRGVLPLRLAVAKHHLEALWRRRPVCVYSGTPLDAEALEAVRRWHCSFCNVPAIVGAQLTLRRLMFPRDLTAGASAPFRMWWQNLGPAPLYAEAVPRLAVAYHGKPVFLTGECRMTVSMGDAVCNAVFTLPDLPDGEFPLLCALESNGQRQRLCMDVPGTDGLYAIGTVHLDHTSRPSLQTMWQEQYADGYYPLEDPAEPEKGG